MGSKWNKALLSLSSGGITLSILGGLGMVNFAQLFAQLLSQWLSILVALFLGGDVDLTNTLGF